MNVMVNQQSLNELALFAGAGGGILGGKLLGWRTVCAVEWEPYPASVLVARQNDGLLPSFPIWDDVQTFNGKPWRGIVDVVSGGFPCQDISAAGKGAGIEGARSGMWTHMARIISEVRPRYAFVENSPMLTSRGLGTVLADLAKMGFDARWCVLGAADVGAPHQRDRIWILATNTDSERWNNRISNWEKRQFLHDKNRDATQDKSEWQGWFSRSRQISSDVANTTQLQRDGGNNNARVSMESCSESEFGNNSWQNNVADTDSTQCKGNERTERVQQEYTDIGKSRWWQTEPNIC
jgi:site-specific DNA-cytosine methylase